MTFISAIIIIGAVALVLWFGFLAVLAAVSTWVRLKSRNNPSEGIHRIAVIIPAHNEEGMVGKTVLSARASHYPPDLFKVFVIADNCDDSTAGEAEATGARCIVRTDTKNRNKGHALCFGLDVIGRTEEPFDAFVFIDADTLLAPDFLLRMSMNLSAGHQIIQGRYSVSDADRTWLTRLTSCGFILKNYFQYPALNFLGMNMPLRGSGMCFSHKIMDRYGWGSTDLMEDVDFSMILIRSGETIYFDFGAVNWQYMPPTLSPATSQRTRWSTGEALIKKKYFKPFLVRSIQDIDIRFFMQTLYLFSPSLSSLLLLSVLLTIVSLLESVVYPQTGLLLTAICLIITMAYASYFLLALTVTGITFNYVQALFMIPVYAVWRVYAYMYGTVLAKLNRTDWLILKKSK